MVGVTIGSGLDRPVVESRYLQEIFLSSQEFTPGLELSQRPVQWIPGLFHGVKAAGGREVDHSPPACALGKNEWSLRLPLIYTFITLETQLYPFT